MSFLKRWPLKNRFFALIDPDNQRSQGAVQPGGHCSDQVLFLDLERKP
jgi:hypothetical protein